MGWRFGFAKVAAQVSAFAEDFCKQIRAHFSIFACLSQKVRHLRPSMLRLHRFLVPLFPRTLIRLSSQGKDVTQTSVEES